MNNRFKWFYFISTRVSILLFLVIIFVKTLIWSSSLANRGNEDMFIRLVILNEDMFSTKRFFVTEQAYKLFKGVDYLFAPAFGLLFINAIIKLIHSRDIFKEE